MQVLHRAVDARRKNNIGLLYHVTVEADLPQSVTRKILSRPGVSEFIPAQPEAPQLGEMPLAERPVIIGAGPAGLVAALELAKKMWTGSGAPVSLIPRPMYSSVWEGQVPFQTES